ncbi:head-tail connector protein [Maritimibacter sp. DP1N21-5]|uniref:head-tail connector protein n=1 Tax=Maritimibacter sp. DP1N21-5 TaxID=2836867 RepID=UPI001C44FCE6|nr:head-tail connector protein [Maritimibacter sp. DP1N21-5]MBV7410171.1 head-tail connector protein [Maritimibacter sp. DP1N21-5]
MMLVELTEVPDGALPVAEFKDHLRLGTGFDEDDLQDGLLVQQLRAALAAIEGRTGKALFERTFEWSVAAWRDLGQQILPIAPVTGVHALEIEDAQGVDEVIDVTRFRLETDLHRSRIVAAGYVLPAIPVGGQALVTFSAGMGATWQDLPADIRQAVLYLAGQYYEDRHGQSVQGETLPRVVEALIHRYRDFRLFRGRWS